MQIKTGRYHFTFKRMAIIINEKNQYKMKKIIKIMKNSKRRDIEETETLVCGM
jgi:hypothetical protein